MLQIICKYYPSHRRQKLASLWLVMRCTLRVNARWQNATAASFCLFCYGNVWTGG